MLASRTNRTTTSSKTSSTFRRPDSINSSSTTTNISNSCRKTITLSTTRNINKPP